MQAALFLLTSQAICIKKTFLLSEFSGALFSACHVDGASRQGKPEKNAFCMKARKNNRAEARQEE